MTTTAAAAARRPYPTGSTTTASALVAAGAAAAAAANSDGISRVPTVAAAVAATTTTTTASKPNRRLVSLRNRLDQLVRRLERSVGAVVDDDGNGKKRRRSRRRGAVLLVAVLAAAAFAVAAAAVIVATIGYAGFWLYHHGQCYARESGIVWREGPSHFLERSNGSNSNSSLICPEPPYRTLLEQKRRTGSIRIDPSSICITSLTDAKSPSRWQRLVRCRDFDDLAAHITFRNFERYAQRHGYRFVDGSPAVDPSRPPAWSKIVAVQRLLSTGDTAAAAANSRSDAKLKTTASSVAAEEEVLAKRCEWVFWLDADTLIMNSSIPLESILPADDGVDLVVAYDRKFTANSGAWLIRNAPWSAAFLSDWWGMTSWVRRSGFSLSGDNAAFGHLVDQRLSSQQQQQKQQQQQQHHHIVMPARCNFNSFGVFLTQSELDRLSTPNAGMVSDVGGAGSGGGGNGENNKSQRQRRPPLPEQLRDEEWYRESDKFYYKGDFIVHASGIDQKMAVLQMMADRAD